MTDRALAFQRIRDLHVPDAGGHECAECGEPQEWPCATARIVFAAWHLPWAGDPGQCPFRHVDPDSGDETEACRGCGRVVRSERSGLTELSPHRHAAPRPLREHARASSQDAEEQPEGGAVRRAS